VFFARPLPPHLQISVTCQDLQAVFLEMDYALLFAKFAI